MRSCAHRSFDALVAACGRLAFVRPMRPLAQPPVCDYPWHRDASPAAILRSGRGATSGGFSMITRRSFLTNSSALAAASLGAAEALAQGGGLAQSGLVGNLEGSQVVTDAAAIPKSFKEAPELAERVKQAKLRPVEKRLPSEPLVLKPLKHTGRYGGTWRRGFVGPGGGEDGHRIQ